MSKNEPYSQRLFAQVQALVDDIDQVLLKDILGNYFGVPQDVLEKLLNGFKKAIEFTKEKAKHFIEDSETDSANLKRSGAFWCEITKQSKQFASNLADWVAEADADLKPHVHNLRVWMMTEVLNCFFNCQYQTASGFKPVLAKTVFDVPIFDFDPEHKQQAEPQEPPKFTIALVFEIFGYNIGEFFTEEDEKEDINFPGAVANKTRSLARQKANHFHREHRNNDDEMIREELEEIQRQQDIALIDVPLSFTSTLPTTSTTSTTTTSTSAQQRQPPN